MFRGKVCKEGKFWTIEVPDLDLMTQGHTKAEAYEMLDDLLKTAIDRNNLKLDIARYRNDTFLLRGRDEQTEARDYSRSGRFSLVWVSACQRSALAHDL